MQKLTPGQLDNIDKSFEEIAHDFALLKVKNKLDSKEIQTIDEMFNTYVNSLETYKKYFLVYKD